METATCFHDPATPIELFAPPQEFCSTKGRSLDKRWIYLEMRAAWERI